MQFTENYTLCKEILFHRNNNEVFDTLKECLHTKMPSKFNIKDNICATFTKGVKFLSSFGPMYSQQEMLKTWKAKM